MDTFRAAMIGAVAIRVRLGLSGTLDRMPDEVVYGASRGASEDTVRNLVTQRVDNLYCSVCMETEADEVAAVVLPVCEHSFHPECVSEWLQINGICPLCRVPVERSPDAESTNAPASA